MSRPRNTEPQANGALARALRRRNPDAKRGDRLIGVFTLLRNCAFKIFRKCGFQDGLVCLVGFCGVYSQAAVGRAIKG